MKSKKDMGSAVCRVITLINFNIPIRDGDDCWEGCDAYYTTGFFDYMYTKRIHDDYRDNQLKSLWDYNIDCTTRGNGRYAHQSVFCFSRDEWNGEMKDTEFWDIEKSQEKMLTFVVFLQTKSYAVSSEEGVNGIAEQCKKFHRVAADCLGEKGDVYTYGTVDKNDFVICIRSSNYKSAVNAIMKLHETDCSVVYSYSVFGISQKRSASLEKQAYVKLNDQEIDSICLKGVTNSIKMDGKLRYSLDTKYNDFCKKLVDELYKGVKKGDYKIYDILGDDDFRLIARKVPLGNLIKQIGKEGLLNYSGSATQFAFFSTHLVLNTQDRNKQIKMGSVSGENIKQGVKILQEQCQVKRCSELEEKLEKLENDLREIQVESQYKDKLIAASHGVYQLLQSLTALEVAPTKKYDFFSLYYPMKTLISIFEKKLECKSDEEYGEKMEYLAENENLYDFIHKISMTLHGTLRTDIQFFQVRDFNATIHYAPAKLRAYYTFFVFMLSTHIREISEEKNKHSYIFCPGMFKDISVKQLSDTPEEDERLMLITVPERYLYFPKNLSIILAHEVGHLTGNRIRKRRERHLAIMACSYRILCMEITRHVGYELEKEGTIQNIDFGNFLVPFDDEKLKEEMFYLNDQMEGKAGKRDTQYYWKYSKKRVLQVYKKAEEDLAPRCWNNYCNILNEKWQDYFEETGKKKYGGLAKAIRTRILFFNSMFEELRAFYELFTITVLPQVLEILHYITSETVSDILAILTLGLKPIEYLQSMTDEVKSGRLKTAFDGRINKVRLALVIYSMECLQRSYHDKSKHLNIDGWNDVYKDVIPTLERGTAIYSMTLEAFSYWNGLSDKIGSTESGAGQYNSLYDQKMGVFNHKQYDFFNDSKLYHILVDYLKTCAEEYLNQLSQNVQYMDSREIVRKAFRESVDHSAIEFMAVIENFLSDFEGKWEEHYLKSG